MCDLRTQETIKRAKALSANEAFSLNAHEYLDSTEYRDQLVKEILAVSPNPGLVQLALFEIIHATESREESFQTICNMGFDINDVKIWGYEQYMNK